MKGGENMWVYWKYGHLPRRFRRRRFNERLEFLLLLGAERAVEHLCIIKISWRRIGLRVDLHAIGRPTHGLICAQSSTQVGAAGLKSEISMSGFLLSSSASVPP